jgi:hypothetical protein
MASDIFTNTTGGVWSLTTNWSAGLPDNNSQVTFADPGAGTYTSVVDSTFTIQSLNVNFIGVTLNVFSNLTTQTLDGNSGTINVESNATLTVGSMNSSSGSITVSDNGTLIVQNLNNNSGTINAATQGLVQLLSNGAGKLHRLRRHSRDRRQLQRHRHDLDAGRHAMDWRPTRKLSLQPRRRRQDISRFASIDHDELVHWG